MLCHFISLFVCNFHFNNKSSTNLKDKVLPHQQAKLSKAISHGRKGKENCPKSIPSFPKNVRNESGPDCRSSACLLLMHIIRHGLNLAFKMATEKLQLVLQAKPARLGATTFTRHSFLRIFFDVSYKPFPYSLNY